MTSSPNKTIPERRGGPRSRVAKRASVAARGSIDSIDCLIRDANETGCRLVSSRLADFPDEISLTVEGVNKPVDARIVWRAGKEAGVAFEETQSRT